MRMPGAGQTTPVATPRLPDRIAIGVLTRELPARLRALPRMVKRKTSNFALKRDPHRHWPQPTKSLDPPW